MSTCAYSVGDRVTYRGHAATIRTQGRPYLIRFDGQWPDDAWTDPEDGTRCLWVAQRSLSPAAAPKTDAESQPLAFHDSTRHVFVPPGDVAQCGDCGRTWCVSCCPTPAGRCPFEYDHEEPQEATQGDSEPSGDTSALTAQVAALTSQIHAMQDDVATIGEHLKKTAERHEWCGEYEEHLGRLLADLSEHTVKTLESAAKRTQSFFVDYSWSTMVEAVDAEQAERIGRERYESDGWDGEFTVSEAE